MGLPTRESSWHRSWRDTKHGWSDWRFLLLGAIVAPLAGFAVGNLTSDTSLGFLTTLRIVISGLVFVWIWATVRAPYRQRDEARAQVATVNNRDSVDTNSRNFGVIVDPKVSYLTLTSRKQKYDDPMEISVHVKFAVTAPVLLHKLELVFSRDGHQIEYRSEVTGGSEGAPNLPNLPVTLKQTATYSVAFEMTWSRLIGSPFVNLRAFTGDHECLSNEFRLKESEQEFDFTQSN